MAPSTFRRVLAAHPLVLPQQPPAPKQPRTPWPHWLVWEPNRIWIWDVTHFGRARRCVFAIVDMVSRCWIATLVSTAQTSTQVRVIFDQALVAQDLDELLTEGRLDLDIDDPDRAILLAVCDNGPAMTSHDTRAYTAMMAIAQHHRQPRTPTDQARTESFFSHITHEWPHLDDITVLRLAAEAITERLRAGGVDFDTVGGLTLGADALCAAIAVVGGANWCIIRKEPKGRGTNRLVEGTRIGEGNRVLLVGDVVTTAGSILKAYDSVRATGAQIVAAATLVDRGDDACRSFDERGVPYFPMSTYQDMGIPAIGTETVSAAAG